MSKPVNQGRSQKNVFFRFSDSRKEGQGGMPAVARRRVRARTEERSCGQAKPETCGATRDATEADCHSPAATRHEERSPEGSRERSMVKTLIGTNGEEQNMCFKEFVTREREGGWQSGSQARSEQGRTVRTSDVSEWRSRDRRRSNRRLSRTAHTDAVRVAMQSEWA